MFVGAWGSSADLANYRPANKRSVFHYTQHDKPQDDNKTTQETTTRHNAASWFLTDTLPISWILLLFLVGKLKICCCSTNSSQLRLCNAALIRQLLLDSCMCWCILLGIKTFV